MSKGDKLKKFMDRDDRLHSKFQSVWWLWYRTDNQHPDKTRLYNRAMKLDELCNENTRQMTDLINGGDGS
jgi:hypothetical protein